MYQIKKVSATDQSIQRPHKENYNSTISQTNNFVKGDAAINYKLTEAEREFVEKHHNLIYFYIRKNGLDESEYYDILAITLIRAAKKYMADKRLQKYTFATIAMNMFFSAVGTDYRKKKRAFKYNSIMNLEDNITETMTLAETLSSRDNIESVHINMAISSLESNIKNVLMLYATGYTQCEIARKYNVSQVTIGRWINKAKNLLKSELEEVYGL